LAPGDHRIGLLGAARRPGGHDDEVVVLRTARGFRVGVEPAVIEVEISAPARSNAPLEIAVKLRGALAVGEPDEPRRQARGARAKDPNARALDMRRCDRKEPLGRALCHGQTRLDDALQRRDPSYVVCVRDKLDALRSIAETLSEPTPRRPPGASAFAASPAGEADLRIMRLERELDGCPQGSAAAFEDE
jgi:hypothetical protein